MGAWAGGGDPAGLPVPRPQPPLWELGHTMPWGLWGGTLCLHRPPRNVAGRALGAPESGATGTGPGGGRAALGRWRWSCGWPGTRQVEGPGGKRVWSIAGSSARAQGSVQGRGSARVSTSPAHLLPLVHDCPARALCPIGPGRERAFLWAVHSCPSPKTSLLGEAHHCYCPQP